MPPRTILSEGCLGAIIRLATASPPGGAFVEVGVYQGGSAYELWLIAQKQRRAVHLFDTFVGMPFCGPLDRHPIGDFGDVDLASIRDAMPTARFHVGVYPDTHPADLGPLSFIHCDCDQYASYRAVIDMLYPLLMPGGILLFDDYPYLPGAKQAVEESFALWQLRDTGNCRYYVVKP
jgi:hypothetical protein